MNVPNQLTWNHMLFIMLFCMICSVLHAQNIAPGNVRVLNTVYPSPSEEQKCMLMDEKGIIWIGSDFGLKAYDGYRFTSYRNDTNTPNILPHNTVLSLAEGKDDCLWIGTRNGLVKMNKRKGTFTTIPMDNDNQRMVYALCVTQDGTLWMGSNDGLSRYTGQGGKSFITYNDRNVTVIEKDGKRHPLGYISVKSFAVDKDGQIYIGTWERDLYRLDPKRNILYKYNLWKPEDKISAYSLKLDQKGQLWIGTWGNGVKCLTNPRNIQNPGYVDVTNSNTAYAIIYKIAEDPTTGTIWVCSREGLSVANENNPKGGLAYYPEIGIYNKFKTQAVNDVCSDQQGNVWALSRFNGLYHIGTASSPFTINSIMSNASNLIGINNIYTQDGVNFMMSLTPVGLAMYNRQNQHLAINEEISGFNTLPYDIRNTHITAIVQRPNGEIWLGSEGYGILALRGNQATVYDKNNCKFVKKNIVNTLFTTRKGALFIGENDYLDYILPSGKIGNINLHADVNGICDDHKGNIWIALQASTRNTIGT